jgi:purine-nucleoside phosphorylase
MSSAPSIPAAAAPLALRIAASADVLRAFAAAHRVPLPTVAVLLGSGWGSVAERVDRAQDLPYGALPAFPPVAVDGHAGTVRVGWLGGTPVWVLRGRAHAYESGDAGAMKGAVRSLAAAGVRTLVQTNAAGSLDLRWRPGSLMLVRDHLNLVQASPLVGDTGDDRFVDLRDAYDPRLCEQARAQARRLALDLHEGVYAWVLGPQFETPAEIRMLALLGAQAVGMSTVPETILARQAGLRVLALSMFTNMACGLDDMPLGHGQTLSAAARAAPAAAALVAAIVGDAAAA